MEATGRPVAIENCNNEHAPSPRGNADWADHGGQCPYNWYRSSTDINPSWASIMNNFASVVGPTQNLTHPMSHPGCWAYPDMRACALHAAGATLALLAAIDRPPATHFTRGAQSRGIERTRQL